MRLIRGTSVRLRMTLAFAGVMALVLAATGLFLYVQVAADLDSTIEQGLRTRAGDVTALIKQADSGLAESGRSPLTEQGENLSQILDASGRVVDATPTLRDTSLLDDQQLSRARRGTIIVDRQGLSDEEEEAARLLATPVRAQDRDVVVVVGAQLEQRQDALRNLGGRLLLGGPIALILASLAGYGVAAGALRPVEAMRRRAAEIQTASRGQRLPVPPSTDEVARLGTTLNEMLDRLEESFTRERKFVADASHELRTPLASLKTEIELVLRHPRTVEEFEQALRSAADSTDRLVQLAEDLLVIAQSDQDGLPVRLDVVSAVDVFDGVVQRFARAAREAGVELRVDAAPETALALADSLRLEQALGNMVDNALRHGVGPITLSARTTGDAVELHVSDAGPGFPDDFVDKAFMRFTRADGARHGQGSGLGLAIVAAIAKAHHGEVGVGEGPAGGADVWFSVVRAG